jgi:hypothetical protein
VATTTAEASRGGRAVAVIRSHPAISTGVGLVALSALLVRWANTRPGFDPYGWIVWGHQTLAGNLNTNAAPSWKPLPYLFTLPYALFGHYQLWLWMITAVAVSLSGVFFAGRSAYRIVVEEIRPAAVRRGPLPRSPGSRCSGSATTGTTSSASSPIR